MGSRSWGNSKPPFGWRVDAKAAADLVMVGCWLFNEDGGDRYFDSCEPPITGGAPWNTGSTQAGLTRCAARFGNGVNNTSGAVSINNINVAQFGTGPFWVSTWVKITANGNQGVICGTGNFG